MYGLKLSEVKDKEKHSSSEQGPHTSKPGTCFSNPFDSSCYLIQSQEKRELWPGHWRTRSWHFCPRQLTWGQFTRPESTPRPLSINIGRLRCNVSIVILLETKQMDITVLLSIAPRHIQVFILTSRAIFKQLHFLTCQCNMQTTASLRGHIWNSPNRPTSSRIPTPHVF